MCLPTSDKVLETQSKAMRTPSIGVRASGFETMWIRSGPVSV